MITFREWLNQKESDELNEIQRTGSKTDRDEYSGEKEWVRLSKFCKLLIEKDNYSLYRYHDILFLVKDNKYIAHLDGTIDKLQGKKAFYILVMYSEERGAMEIMYQLMKLSGFKYLVSDVMNSDDAVKHLEKIMRKYKYFGIDYKDEKQDVSDTELLNNPDYRIVFVL